MSIIPELHNSNEISIEEILKKEIRFGEPYSKPPILCEIIGIEKNYRMFTKGNISSIKGQSKGGKSTLQSIICGAYLSSGIPLFNKIIFEETNKMLVYVDTEQAEYDAYKILENSFMLAGLREHNLNYKMILLRKDSPSERLQQIETIMDYYKDKIGLIVLDGCLDLVTEMNSEVQACDVVTMLMNKTYNYKSHCSCVIHENFGGEKSAGHIGSYLQRKSEIILSVNRNNTDTMSIVKNQFIRGAEKFKDFGIYHDKFNGMPHIIDLNNDIEL